MESHFLSALAIGMMRGARLASGFWGGWFQSSIFDVRIFNPYAPSNRSNPYRQHECAKRRAYEE